MPVFLDDEELIGYTAIKGHWLDIGGKEPYSTDTVDVFQEGTIFPGVKLYRARRAGRRHLPHGARQLARAEDGRRRHQRRGRRRAHRRGRARRARRALRARDVPELGRAHVRPRRGGRAQLLREDPRRPLRRPGPDGQQRHRRRPGPVRGRARGRRLDRPASTSRTRPTRTRARSTARSPRRSRPAGSRSRCSPGSGEAPNEGHFRPIEVVTRPGSMFHPLPPSPCFLYGWPAMQAMEVIYDAVSKAMPDGGRRPAAAATSARSSGGASARRPASPGPTARRIPVGQGAHGARRRREQPAPPRRVGHALLARPRSGSRKNPWLLEQVELAPDSGGAGRHRGGLGVDMFFQMLEDTYVTAAVERTKTARLGSRGRRSPRGPNGGALRLADGTRTHVRQGDAAEGAEGRDDRALRRRRRRLRPDPSERDPGGRPRGRPREATSRRSSRARALPARVRD